MSTSVVSYQPTSFSELDVFCKRICASGLVPAAFRGKPEEAMVAIMAGNEWGLPPFAALQSIAVINGTPRVFGDAMAGIAMNKNLIRRMREWFEGEEYNDDFAAFCEVERPDGSLVVQRFSVADAKLAKLWGKAGPWLQYPKRMLQFRSRSWCLRDAAPHMYFGMSVEEANDIDIAAQPHRGPDKARDITPETPSPGPRASVDAVLAATQAPQDHDDDGVIVDEDREHDQRAKQPDLIPDLPEQHDPDPIKIDGLEPKDAFNTLGWKIDQLSAADAADLLEIYRAKLEPKSPKIFKRLLDLVDEKTAHEAASDPN